MFAKLYTLRTASREFWTSRKATALVEFAFVLPVMVVMYFGTIEITQSVIAKRKLNIAISALADLTARAKTVSSSDMSDTFGAAASIMAPANVTGMQMRISSIIVYPAGNSCVDWSLAQNMTALTAGASFQAPAALTTVPSLVARDYIVAEGYYPYSPITHNLITGTITLHEGPTYLVPRQSDRVLADTTIQTPASKCP